MVGMTTTTGMKEKFKLPFFRYRISLLSGVSISGISFQLWCLWSNYWLLFLTMMYVQLHTYFIHSTDWLID